MIYVIASLELSKMKYNSILVCHPFRQNRPPNYIFFCLLGYIVNTIFITLESSK